MIMLRFPWGAHGPGEDHDAAVLVAVKNEPCGWPLRGHS
jgi:hypothetical protein